MERAVRGQLWIQDGDQDTRDIPLTERETKAQGSRSAKASTDPLTPSMCCPSHNPSWSCACPALKSAQSLGRGCSPALPHPRASYQGRWHISLGIYSLAGTGPLVSQHATYLGGNKKSRAFRAKCIQAPGPNQAQGR